MSQYFRWPICHIRHYSACVWTQNANISVSDGIRKGADLLNPPCKRYMNHSITSHIRTRITTLMCDNHSPHRQLITMSTTEVFFLVNFAAWKYNAYFLCCEEGGAALWPRINFINKTELHKLNSLIQFSYTMLCTSDYVRLTVLQIEPEN